MTPHPYERFLGVESDANAYAMLGLSPGHADTLQVDEALRRRLGEVFRHPDGRSAEAEDVKAALRDAAEAVKRDLQREREQPRDAATETSPQWMSHAVRSRGRPRAAAPVAFNLTAFDRLVLSVLVACGGWNAHSRAQLVALAQTYGVSVQGLLRVMQGLSEYARSGGPRLGVREIIGAKALSPLSPLPPLPMAAPPPVGEALLDRLADNLGQELKRGGAWPTIKLSIIFGIVTLAACIIAVRLVLSPGQRGIVVSLDPPQVTPATAAAASTRAGDAPSTPDGARLAHLARSPTFLGNGLPAEAVNAVDRLPALPAQIDELGRKITVADGAPSEAVYKQWEADLHTVATSWAIGDTSTRAEIDKAIFEVLRAAAETPVVSDRLLKALLPPASVSVPLDVWRGTWMTGAMARISSSPDLSPVVVDRARSQLEIALSQNLRGSMTFEAGGDRWLSQILPQLVQMLAFNDAAYDTWELWLAAQRALGAGERQDEAMLAALRAVLLTEHDLSLPGRPVDVLARLLNIALESKSGIARQRVLELFDDEAITPRDVWVLTSLMASADGATWFPDRLVLPEDADMPHRARVRDDLARAWPAPPSAALKPEGEGAPKFDADAGAAWAMLVDQALAAPPADDQTALMQQIIDASRLIEAAGALVGDMPETAHDVMTTIEEGWAALPVRPTPPGAVAPAKPRSGQPIGADGVWAAKYAEVGKNTQARCEAIQALSSIAGTDLGPIDAALLVREAYRGSPQEVRSTAQGTLAQLFAVGPVVAMQLLDQFPDAPSIESISELIQGVTGRLLPGVRSSAWPAEARLALVQHALTLRDAAGSPIDAFIELLVNSYMNRLAHVKGDSSVASMPTSPAEAAALLLQGVLDRAEFAAPSQPTPADLPSLQRRHNTRLALADGPIQVFIAHQLAVLDATAYTFAAEQPRLRERAIAILREHAAVRARMGGALQQSRDVELAVLELWRLRLGFDPQADADEGGST